VEPFEPKILPKPAADAPETGAAAKAPLADLDFPAAARHDGTHLTARGSIEFGRIVAEELARVVPETGACFRTAH
jgi:hypothetical protein